MTAAVSAVDTRPASDEDAYLSIRNLNKTYPKTETPAVNDVNLDVERGKLIALLGPSGCGKTTTLRMVAGLLEPTSGGIVVNGKDVVSTPVHKRGMGMVFQSYALFPHMTVAENVAFGLQMQKKRKSDVPGLVSEALDMVQLGHLSARKPSELSGGQQQRVALARALVIKPTLLLLDEPLSNLDAKLREAMRHEIKEIQRRSGTTTLFVTHDQDEALDMADRIAILNNGEIEQYGAPTAVYDKPASRFVANFVGKANFLEATDVQSVAQGRYTVVSPTFGRMEVAGTEDLDTARAVMVVRPHRIDVAHAEKADAAGAPAVVGRVTGSAYTGNVQSYEIQVPEGPRIRVDQLTDAARGWRVDDEVSVSFDPDEVFLVTDG